MSEHGQRAIYVLGLPAELRAWVEILGGLVGRPVSSFVTGHAALESSVAPYALIAARALPDPDGEGGNVLARARQKWPDTKTVVLSRIPLGYAPSALKRWGISAITAEGPWMHRLADALSLSIPDEGASLWSAIDEANRAGVEDVIASESPLTALALRSLTLQEPSEQGLRRLEAIIREGRWTGPSVLYETVLDLAVELGTVGFSAVEAIVQAPSVPADLRGRALRHVAERFSFEVSLPLLQSALKSRDPLTRMDAGQALIEVAVREGTDDSVEILLALVMGTTLPVAIRERALEAWAAMVPRPQLASMAHRLADDPAVFETARRLTETERPSVEVEMQTILDESRPSPVRKAALRSLSQIKDAPWKDVLNGLGTTNAEVVSLAFELSGAVEAAVRFGPVAQRAVLLGAMKAGPRGRSTVASLAAHAEAAMDVRVRAVRLLGIRSEASEVAPVLEPILRHSEIELAHAAVWASVQLGPLGHALLHSVLSSSARPEIRGAAVDALDGYANDDLVSSALVRASKDPDPGVREVAVRVAARRSGARIDPLVARLVELGAGSLQCAAVAGAADLGAAGFQALARLVTESGLDLSARRWAWAHLSTHPSEDVASVRARLAQEAPAVLEAPGEPGPASVSSPEEASGPVPWDETGPSRPAVPPERRLRSPRMGRPSPPSAPRVADTVPEAPADLAPTQPMAPASTSGVELPKSPPVVAPPARASTPRTEAPKSSPIAEPSPVSAVSSPPRPTVRPVPPAPPETPPAPRFVDEARAMQAFATAMRMGRDGYRGLRALADSDRIPPSVRAQALRHLAADFPDRDVTAVLERALGAPDFQLQKVALQSLMLRKDAHRPPIERLVMNEAVELSTRIRALRFLAARWPKREVKTLLEESLNRPEPELQRVALECLFTSMRFMHASAVEDGLINLLKEHDAEDVKVSAARALGAFGGAAGLKALQGYTGVLRSGELKGVAQAAIDRIRVRLKEERVG